MKKLLLTLLVPVILFTACGKEEPLGSVKLDPPTADITYGTKKSLTPIYEPGQAESLIYEWSSSADSIVSVRAGQGGLGEAQAHRIGDAIIYFKGYKDGDKDKKILLTATCKISVTPRTAIFGVPYFKKGTSKTTLTSLGVGSLDNDLSTDKLLVFTRTPDAINGVEKTIFELDDNAKLVATYAYLQDTRNNKEQAGQYIEERFKYTGKTLGAMTLYNAGVSDSYAPGTMAALFLGTDPGNGIPGLGIKFW